MGALGILFWVLNFSKIKFLGQSIPQLTSPEFANDCIEIEANPASITILRYSTSQKIQLALSKYDISDSQLRIIINVKDRFLHSSH